MVNDLQDKCKPLLLEFLIEFHRMDFDTFLNVVNDQKIEEALLKAATADATCGNLCFHWQRFSIYQNKEHWDLLLSSDTAEVLQETFFALILNACVKV